MDRNMYFVTGGAGFIGSNYILSLLKDDSDAEVINIDKLTYAGNKNNLTAIEDNKRYHFVHGDIGDTTLVTDLLNRYKPHAIIHFAAETHVDRSIDAAAPFIETNVIGTCRLLKATLGYWKSINNQTIFRFVNISTDEVFGSLDAQQPPTKEDSPYAPNSPYAASKASADHFVRAYHHTYGLPTLTTYSSNNFGARQFPEKLIPLIITNALKGKLLPIYGDGQQKRNWIHVDDNCTAIRMVLKEGEVGESYNIGDINEITNLVLTKKVCSILDELCPNSKQVPHEKLITHVDDRPGHDRRYALDTSKLKNTIGWAPHGDFDTKLRTTVEWYLNNKGWLDRVTSGEYRQWIQMQYKGEV